MTLTLYAHPLSSYCQKVLTALYENDTPFDFAMLDGSEPVASAFAALAPLGKFPVLTEGTRVVAGSDDHHRVSRRASSRRDAVHPRRSRCGARGADDRPLLRQLFRDAVQQRIVGAAIGRDKADEDQMRGQLDAAYRWLDGWMAGREWAAGGAFSLADCAAAPALLYADWTHAIPKEHANVWAYRDRLLARPSYARALDEARPYRHMFPLGAPTDRD